MILVSCTQKPVEGVVYEDFKNDLERFGFHKNVKKVVTNNSKIESFYSDKMEPPILVKVQEFSKDGFLLKEEEYDYEGKFDESTTYEYDTDNNLIKTFGLDPSSLFETSTELEERIAFDKEKRMSTFKIYRDSVFKYKVTFFNDEHENTIKELTEYPDGTNSEVAYDNQYVHGDKLAFQIRSMILSEIDTIQKLEYDDQARLIKETYNNYSTEYKYDGAILVEQKSYSQSKSGDKSSIKIFKYNKYHYPIYKSYKHNEKVTTEEKYEYEYDEKGNWIKQIVYSKITFDKSNEFKKRSENLREITYWE